MRSLQGGERRLTKLGKGFFRDKYYEYLVHVPVIIRGRRRSGRNAGAGCERRDWLPVNELGGATRHPAHLTEEQVAQRVRQQVEALLDPGGPILQLSDETYFLDPEGHWVVSTQSTRYRNSRTEVETLLRHAAPRLEAPRHLRRGVVSKTHCSAQNLRLGAQTADHWVRKPSWLKLRGARVCCLGVDAKSHGY